MLRFHDAVVNGWNHIAQLIEHRPNWALWIIIILLVLATIQIMRWIF